MSTELLPDNPYGFGVTRFWGGEKRGPMVQLTVFVGGRTRDDLMESGRGYAYTSVPLRRFRAMVRLLAMKDRKGLL